MPVQGQLADYEDFKSQNHMIRILLLSIKFTSLMKIATLSNSGVQVLWLHFLHLYDLISVFNSMCTEILEEFVLFHLQLTKIELAAA